jgi:predicted phosphodiesterase
MPIRIALISDTHYGAIPDVTDKVLDTFYEELREETPQVILHAGDWNQINEEQFEAGVRQLRKAFPLTPIVGTRGNHCYWSSFKYLSGSINFCKKVFKKYNILSEGIFWGVFITSYNSWYGCDDPPSKDGFRMPPLDPRLQTNMAGIWGYPANIYLRRQSMKGCKRVIKSIGLHPVRANVILTHFSPFPYRGGKPAYDGMRGCAEEHQMLLNAKPDVICYGHSHQYDNLIIDGVKILNCGSDYTQPKHIIFEV